MLLQDKFTYHNLVCIFCKRLLVLGLFTEADYIGIDFVQHGNAIKITERGTCEITKYWCVSPNIAVDLIDPFLSQAK